MSEVHTRKRRQPGATERQQVLRITRRVSATLGNDFLQSLVKHIADAIGADCVYAGELIRGTAARIETLAVCVNGEWSENFEQDYSGSAAAHVVSDGHFVSSVNVTELFPEDRVLERLAAQAFVGYRLSDSDGQVIGVLAAVYSKRLENIAVSKAVMEAFLPRAAAELKRKREYEALRRADERHRAFIASSMDAMWRFEFEKPIPLDLDEDEQIERIYRYGYLAECNEALARLIGAASAEELVGARFAAIVPPDDARLVGELRASVRSGYRAAVVETMPLDPNGQRMYRLRSQFGVVENGELQRIWGTIRDITELKRTELTLQAAERRCREMLERLRVPAVVVDPKGRVLFANDALHLLGNWPVGELAGKNWFEVLGDEKIREQWKAAVAYDGSGPTVAHLEGLFLCAPGVSRLVAWDTTLLLDADGKVESIAAVGTDITSQRALEAQVRQAHKLEGVERLAAAVAHDYNNLLTVVAGQTDILQHRAGDSEIMRRSIAAIQVSAMQCAALTKQLYAVGRKQDLHPVVLNLNSVISDAAPVVAGLLGHKITLELQLEPALRPVNADPVQLERVFTNLAANARDAMPDGGRLTIVTTNADLDETAVSGRARLAPGSYVRLTVTDTGTGMDEEVKARIFDPYFTTKPPGSGTGLGLSTVHGIVAQSAGFIWVDSRPKEGASFTILLPAVLGPTGP